MLYRKVRVSKLHTRARCVCALSIQRLEEDAGVCGRCGANGYGNSIFSPICKLLVLRYLENEHVREPQFDALRWGMTWRRIAREASAAPAASFKSETDPLPDGSTCRERSFLAGPEDRLPMGAPGQDRGGQDKRSSSCAWLTITPLSLCFL